MSKVILKTDEFQRMVKEIQKLREEKAELIKANDFLNAQIKEFNREFGDDNTGKKPIRADS